jgi:hypothetical protein
MRRIAVGLVVVVVLAGAGCTTTRSGPLRAASVPVPPSDEIEILDPGVGTTHVLPVVTGVGDDGLQRVDVPPAVLVHRYYPSGDRSFQAQFLPGGPSVVAVNHPKTMERVYVPVTLPPGAPRVSYSGKSIVYDYGPQSVTLSFGACGQPTVKYSQGTAIGERVRNFAENVGEGTAELAETAGVPQGWQRVKAGVGKVFTNTAEAVGNLRRPLPTTEE